MILRSQNPPRDGPAKRGLTLRFLLAALMLACAFTKLSPGQDAININKSTHDDPGTSNSLLVLGNVALVDGNGGEILQSMDIVIDGHIIREIAPHDVKDFPPGTTVFDLTGNYALPGLIDGHTHISNNPERGLRFALQVGITALRDMGGDGAYLRQLQQSIRRGETIGPELFFSALVGGPELMLNDNRAKLSTPMSYELGQAPWMRVVDDSCDIAQVIDGALDCGATGIKVYSHVTRNVVERLATEAHGRGLMVWSHSFVHPATAEDVVLAGMDVISHAPGLLYTSDWTPDQGAFDFDSDAVESESFEHLLDTMQAKGTMLDPTMLIFLESLTHIDTDESSRKKDAINMAVRRVHEKGIPIIAGTDSPLPRSETEIPALHKELRILVDEVGLTPLQAISAATRNNAAALGIDESYGTIEAGKVADIVVLEADPTRDIANLSRVKLVIKKGRPVNEQPGGNPK